MKFDSPQKLIKCPICEKMLNAVGQAKYYDKFSVYDTQIYYCALCSIFYRDINGAKMFGHYHAASYVQECNEQRFYETRIDFFRYILNLFERYTNIEAKNDKSKITFVDFGSSYGHLLELGRQKGFNMIGIELNTDLRNSCAQKGMKVYKEISEVPEKVDVVTMIDSLYCVPNCTELLNAIKMRMKTNGLLIARVTNRNMYAKLKSRFVSKGDFSSLGDATIGYSLKGIKKLLFVTGFQLVKVIPDRAMGKKLPIIKKTLYFLSYLLTLLTAKKIIFTPGIIVIAKIDTKI